MSITELLSYRVNEYIYKYGYAPQNVYLGKQECRAIVAECQRMNDNLTRPSFILGMRIIAVHEETYIGFGIGN